MRDDPPSFDPTKFVGAMPNTHNARLGFTLQGFGDDWIELALPWRAEFAGDETTGVLASGPLVTLMDMAMGMSAWRRRGAFVPHATLDLRIDYLRAARERATIVGRAECYRLTRSIAFCRGQAHDGDPDDPIANVVSTFMLTHAE